MPERRRYRVVFFNRGQVYELYARRVGQGDLLGFIEIEGLLFGEKSSVVVDPSEESLRKEFAGVKVVHVPVHAVVRVDEVEKEGASRIAGKAEGAGTLTPFPSPGMGRPGDGPGSS